MNITVTGIADLQAKLDKIGGQDSATQAVARAVYSVLNQTQADAARETPVGGGIYSPRDPHPGLLRASGIVPFPDIEDGIVKGQVGFGGAANDYAVPQHERTDFRHQVGKAHYLSDPFQRNIGNLPQAITTEIQATIQAAK